jgi:tetratricopeptide (TPR) repeat protein
MGQKSRQKRLTRSGARSESATGTPLSAGWTSRAKRKYHWIMRIVASVLVPVVLLAVIEGALRIFSYGYSTKFFEKADDGKTLTTNWKFAWQFYPRKTATSPTPILFPKEKAPGTKRIFILGESAAAGTPDPAFGFARMLELMLREDYPTNRFEVLNVAMRGIDSHIVRQIASECAELSPDLFLIYMGNNELIGLHAPSPEEFRLSSNIRWLRFKLALHRLKLMQFGGSMLARLGKEGSRPKQDMEFFRRQRLAFDDSRREPVYRNYEINLRDICAMAERAGAQAIVCSVGVNLRDFPPLASLHKASLNAEQQRHWEKLYAEGVAAESARNFSSALVNYEEAARIDNHFGDLLFRIARCYEASGKLEEARRHYSFARDWDAIQFRADRRLNNSARSVATNSGARIHFADIEKRCAESSLAQGGVPGGAIFQEHVHFRFDGDHIVATALLPEVASVFKLPAPSKPPLSRDECARGLAYTAIDDFNVRSSIARLTANPPFLDQLEHSLRQAKLEAELKERTRQATSQMFEQALAVYQQAVAARPDDWMLRFNYGNLLKQVGNKRAAANEFAAVVKQLPRQRAFRLEYGNALLDLGQAREAAEQFEAVLKLDPQLEAAQEALAAARSRIR